jgi:hypothetical protein
MGRRGHERDDDRAQGVGTAVAEPGKQRNLHDHVLGLQRDYGNAAVTTAIQRKGSGAASTDAPGYKKPKEKPKKPGKVEDYTPEPDPTLSSMSAGELTAAGLDAWQKPDANKITDKHQRDIWFEKAARYFEQAWLKTPGKAARAIALNISRVYGDLGDSKRKAWWSKVHTGEIDPRAPQAAPGSDQHF